MEHESKSTLRPPPLPLRRRSSPPDPTQGDHEHDERAVVEARSSLADGSTSSFLETSAQKFRQGWTDAQTTAFDLSVTMSTAVLGDDLTRDLRDWRRALVGDDSICEHCKQFRVLDAASPVWETPLERVIRLSRWCNFCRLLLHMLSQPQNDPLLNSKVAEHVPQEISRITMSQLAQYDWALIDVAWPFGRTNQEGKHSTYVLGKYEEDIVDLFNDYRAPGVTTRAIVLGLRGVTGKQSKRSRINRRRAPDFLSEDRTLQKGRQIEKASQVQYRKQCLLRITLHKSPGILLVDCRGYTGLHNSQMEVLSRFRLHVADHQGSPPLQDMNRPRFRYSRKVDPRWIDLSVAKQWLWECETKHRSKCSQHGWEIARENPQFLRVIDVHKECVVLFNDPVPCRYVALSYMWGGFKGLLLRFSNIAILTSDGGLRRYMKEIPRTVLDAMEVVKAMGERYLWVDALVSSFCSPRSSKHDRH